jgi:hypothetical protein
MLKAQIKPRTEYALREKLLRGAPFQRVRTIEHIRGNKWKVEWIEPNPGLVDYVKSGQLIVPWKDHRAFLKEEAAETNIREHNERRGYVKDSPPDDALSEIFEAMGERITYYRGQLTGAPEAIDRIKSRAGMETGAKSSAAYTDREGVLHVPFDEALELGRAFCAREPQTVLVKIEAAESKWSQEVGHLGKEYMAELLNDYGPAWALIRQWAGHDAAVAAREERIKRLERLVWDAVYALQRAKLDEEASRLRRVLEGR